MGTVMTFCPAVRCSMDTDIMRYFHSIMRPIDSRFGFDNRIPVCFASIVVGLRADFCLGKRYDQSDTAQREKNFFHDVHLLEKLFPIIA